MFRFKAYEQMNVIFDSANRQWHSVHALYDASEIGVEPWVPFFNYDPPAFFC